MNNIDSIEGMVNLYDSEKTRLQLGNLEEPPHLILNKEEYDWYLNYVTDLINHYNNSDSIGKELKEKVLKKEMPLLFRGVVVKINT